MARKKYYTSDQIKGYIKSYVLQKNDYSAITATALAEYCNQTLHLLPPVTYQTFTRDKEVMQYIDKINADVHEKLLIPPTKGASVFIDSFYIEKTASTEEVRKKAYEELERREDLIRELQIDYQRQSKLLAKVTEERDALLKESKELAVKLVRQKEELTKLKKDNQRSHSLLARFNEYFKKFLYDPIVLRHVTQYGWISDKEDAIKRCSADADIIGEIASIYKDTHSVTGGNVFDEFPEDDMDDLPFPDAEQEKEIQEIVDSDSAAFLEKLRSL